MKLYLIGLALLAAGACGDDGSDAAADAGVGAADAQPGGDAAPLYPRPGFGAITGECNALSFQLESGAPYDVQSSIEFERAFVAVDLEMLTAGGQEIIADDNAGGSSLYSEVFAYELLARCEDAGLLKTETEIVYDTVGTITDLLLMIDDHKIGVSVTRAVGFPFDDPYTVTQARALLDDKLGDIVMSTANVSAADRWTKQILAILAYGPGHAESLATALSMVEPSVLTDTIVWIIVTDGVDDFIYCDGACN